MGSDAEAAGADRNWSFSTNAFTEHELPAALEAIARSGYRGVEILADRPHLVPHRYPPQGIEDLRRLLGYLGLAVANLNANTTVSYYEGCATFWEPLFEPSLAHPDSNLRFWRLLYTQRAIDAAAALGCPSVSVTSGRPQPGTLPERSLDLLEVSLRNLVRYAGERGVRIGIEYEPGLLIESAADLRAFLDRLPDPGLGANLDIGHSRVAGEDLEETLTLLKGRIFHLHLEDIRGRRHYHLVPGQGDMDFGEVFRLLDRFGYTGFITVELYTYPHAPEAAARQALTHLRARSRAAASST